MRTKLQQPQRQRGVKTRRPRRRKEATGEVGERQGEEARKRKLERLRRALLSSTLKQCRKAQSKHKRVRCEKRAKKSTAAQNWAELSGRPDSNRGPRPPKGRALPGCATPRCIDLVQSRAKRSSRSGLESGGPATARFRPDGRRPPIFAAHYDLDAVGSLDAVAAPPYDVIDAQQRAELLERSPYNAVAIDLPKPYGETGPQETGDEPYAARGRDDGRLARGRRPRRRHRAGDLGDDPGLHRSRRRRRGPATASSAGSGSRTSTPARCCPTSAPCPGPRRTGST